MTALFWNTWKSTEDMIKETATKKAVVDLCKLIADEKIKVSAWKRQGVIYIEEYAVLKVYGEDGKKISMKVIKRFLGETEIVGIEEKLENFAKEFVGAFN